jgi:hypothetical protein
VFRRLTFVFREALSKQAGTKTSVPGSNPGSNPDPSMTKRASGSKGSQPDSTESSNRKETKKKKKKEGDQKNRDYS